MVDVIMVLNNFVTFAMVLFLCGHALRLNISTFKILLAGAVGAAFMSVLPLLNMNGFYLLPVKILVGFLLCLIATKGFELKRFLTYLFVYYIFSFIMAGLYYFLTGTFGEAMNAFISPAVLILGIILTKTISVFYRKKHNENFMYNLEIFYGRRSVKVKAFLDTGNSLKDEVTKLPVIIINYGIFHKLFDVGLAAVLTKKLTQQHPGCGRYINYSGVGGRQSMFVFKPDRVAVDGGEIEVMVGLSVAGFGTQAEFDCLLNGSMATSPALSGHPPALGGN